MKSTRRPDGALVLSLRRGRVPALDFLRGFSIFTIVLMHVIHLFFPEMPVLLYQATALGGSGAHVFLFCSGFGLYASQRRQPLSATAFWLRRFSRVYLPYVPVVLASACVPALCIGVERLRAVAAHLLLYKMFSPTYIESLGVQFWFISTIIQFYLLFPLLDLLCRKIGMKRMIVLACAVSLAWWVFLAVAGLDRERVFNSFCLQFLWEFVLGMALADYLSRGGRIVLRRWVLALAALVGLGLLAVTALRGGYPIRLFNDPFALLGYGALALLIYALGRPILAPTGAFLGSISYAWYLTHMLVVTLVFTQIPDMPLLRGVFATVAFVLSIFVAAAYHALCGWGAGLIRRIKHE